MKNLESLFDVKQVPIDTWMRERLDKVGLCSLRRSFTEIATHLQRGKALDKIECSETTRNDVGSGCEWHFTTEGARTKLSHLYPHRK